MILKTELIAYCNTVVEQRVKEIDAALTDANSSIFSDTKSSAGDKYETSREMIQQDINRYQKQLLLAQQDLAILDQIKSTKPTDYISNGSLVETTLGKYFISISMGACKFKNTAIFIISSVSPIGQLLMGKKKGDIILFNGKQQTILTVE